MSSARNLQEVALASLIALRDRKAFKQTDVAKRLKTADAAVSETLSGKRKITLRFLEAVSDVTGIHPGEFLVDAHRDQMKIVNPLEMQLLRYVRSWPASTRAGLIAFLSYFGDEDPATSDERRAHEQIRRLDARSQRMVYAYLTFLTEGGLPPDLQKDLTPQETNGSQSPRPARAARKTPTTKARA